MGGTVTPPGKAAQLRTLLPAWLVSTSTSTSTSPSASPTPSPAATFPWWSVILQLMQNAFVLPTKLRLGHKKANMIQPVAGGEVVVGCFLPELQVQSSGWKYPGWQLLWTCPWPCARAPNALHLRCTKCCTVCGPAEVYRPCQQPFQDMMH